MRPARFHQLRDRVVGLVDHRLAEPVELHPMNSDGQRDTDRDVVEFEAILRVGDGRPHGPTGGISGSWASKIEAGKAKLSVDRAAYPDLIFRKGDRLKAVSRKGEPWFELDKANDRMQPRLVLELNEV